NLGLPRCRRRHPQRAIGGPEPFGTRSLRLAETLSDRAPPLRRKGGSWVQQVLGPDVRQVRHPCLGVQREMVPRHTAPVARRSARNTRLSVPALLASRRFTVKEPLAPCVVLEPFEA